MARKAKSLEEKLERLEQIQTILDRGSVPIDELLKLYEEGMSLVKSAHEYLQQAEQRIESIQPGSGPATNDKEGLNAAIADDSDDDFNDDDEAVDDDDDEEDE